MNTLIIKLGATGDVVRTTPLVRRLSGKITWITSAKNKVFVEGISPNVRCLIWDERCAACDTAYDLVISLEDDREVGSFLSSIRYDAIFGAYLDKSSDKMTYSENSATWFDLSLISKHGRTEADRLKLQNRQTYQDHIFNGLNLAFHGDEYVLPAPKNTGLYGDIAISPLAGPVWPMKAWAYFEELQNALAARGYIVNILSTRASLLEHLADIQGHRCVVSGDSLPMHLALGSGIRCVSIFNCTSPWEIHDYGRQIKLISPLLDQFFYQRRFDPRATTAISLESVLEATLSQFRSLSDVQTATA